jgi:hypothetical protein
MARYTPPELNGHKVAYRGRRFWIVEVDEDHPFDWVAAESGQYAIYDALFGSTIAYASEDPGGGYACEFHYGPHVLGCYVNALKDMGRVVSAESWKTHRNDG